MRESVYQHIANVINENYTWIKVSDTKQHREFISQINGKSLKIQSRVLTLETCIACNHFKKGHIWHIPEYDLDKTASMICKTDAGFRRRYIEGTLTFLDVETVINRSSFGLINLDLSKY